MRRRIPVLAVLALPWLAACAAGSGSETSGLLRLGYGEGGPDQRSYRLADTISLDLDMGGQVMDVGIRSNALLDMAFEPAPEGVEVTTSWRDLAVTISNPMGPPERVTEDDVEGPLVFTLDRRGSAEVLSKPTLTGSAAQMVVPEEVVEAFFPRLTGTPPTPGMSWTDTVAYASQASEARTVNETVVTYTVAGDTLVDGRSLLRIDMDGAGSMLQEGVTQGMDFVQDLTGGVEGFILWDLAEGEMVYKKTESSYSGSMTVTAAPYPLGVSLRGVSHVRLAEDGGEG
jgi:hypothetical protein